MKMEFTRKIIALFVCATLAAAFVPAAAIAQDASDATHVSTQATEESTVSESSSSSEQESSVTEESSSSEAAEKSSSAKESSTSSEKESSSAKESASSSKSSSAEQSASEKTESASSAKSAKSSTSTSKSKSKSKSAKSSSAREVGTQASSSDVNVSYGSATGIKDASANFANGSPTLINGSAFLSGEDFDMTIKSVTTDTSITDAVATYDISLKYGDTDVTNLSPALSVTLVLNTTTFDADNYYVYHGSDTTPLSSSYTKSSGTLTFSTSAFSNFTLVEKNSSTTSSSGTTTTTSSSSTTTTSSSTLAKTGDPLDAMPFAVLGIAALAIVGFALRELRRAE